ncbi:MAG: hypothetical protein IIV94_00525 [Clostridiales bacterium]|nr:hypothetical protein [Clostridiales bacterium]
MFRKILALVLAAAVLFSMCSCMKTGPKTRIPELEYIEDFDAGYYYVSFSSYDGETLNGISFHQNLPDEAKELIKNVERFLKTEGRKVTGWTTDDIKYPVYSLTIETRLASNSDRDEGVTVIYSNGYLITQSGTVYKCDPDLKPFMKADDNDYTYETELDDLSGARAFSPLAYTDSKWNKDMLLESSLDKNEIVPDIDAEALDVYEEDGFQVVRVSMTNNGTEKWNYDDRSIFVGLEVKVGGKWYHLYHDPSIEDTFTTVLSANCVLQPGEDICKDFCPGLYGKLHPGEYRLLIWGRGNGAYNCAIAEFKVK